MVMAAGYVGIALVLVGGLWALWRLESFINDGAGMSNDAASVLLVLGLATESADMASA